MYGVFHMLQAIMEVEYLFYYICYSFLCLEYLYYQWNLRWEELLKSSIIRAYHELEQPGQKWHIHGYLGMIGNYILLFFYTTVSGWMLGYFIKYVTGDITKNTDSSQMFADVTANPWIMFVWMAVIVLIAVIICSMGLQNGVEKITKYMMLILLGLIVVLAIHSLTLDGAAKGIQYFLIPDMNKIEEAGLGNIIIEAMRQAFFYFKCWNGLNDDIWKLYRKRTRACRRGNTDYIT